MSDFANLLGRLQETAQEAAKEAKRGESGTKKKRRRTDDDEADRNPGRNESERSDSKCTDDASRIVLPPDARDLTVTVSFLCIGAQKAGTTWLHSMLRRDGSPFILPETKEVHFWDWHRRKGLGWYSRQFGRSASERGGGGGRRRQDREKPPQSRSRPLLCGEITPCYSVLPPRDVREIRALFPDVRIVFVARDLVDRAWSALLMELRNASRGVVAGAFGIDDDADDRQIDKFDRESDPDRYGDEYFVERLNHSTHATRSDYASGLRTWLREFPAEQLLVVDYRDISAEPRRVLRRVCAHVGVEENEARAFIDSIDDEEISRHVNAAVGSTSGRSIRPSLRRKMENIVRPYAVEFNRLLGELGYAWRLDEYAGNEKPSVAAHDKG